MSADTYDIHTAIPSDSNHSVLRAEINPHDTHFDELRLSEVEEVNRIVERVLMTI